MYGEDEIQKMGNVFLNLLNLYSKQSDMSKTPLEDFTTEIFASILSKDTNLLDRFMNEVLNIEGESFKIDTQQKYKLEHDRDCIIDIVIWNESSICFLENKVNSSEGHRQLERYKRVLENLKDCKKIYLRYCTKYYDGKKIEDIDFVQIRWRDIYLFLQDYQEDTMINEFLGYMRRMDMASAGNFNFHDMLVMNHVMKTISKMDECLDAVIPTFKDYFGNPYTYDYERLKEIPKHGRYTIWAEDIFVGENKASYSKVILGFEFYENEIQSYPILFLAVVCNKKHVNYQKIRNEILNHDNFDYTEEEDSIWGWYEKPLSDFLSVENQLDEIEKWFIEKLDLLHMFKEKTKNLNWRCMNEEK